MDTCFHCGISEERSTLFDAVGPEGFVKVCERCSRNEPLPVIRKPTEEQLRAAERRKSVHERIVGMSTRAPAPVTPSRNEPSLRTILDKTYQERHGVSSSKAREDLVHNFHWVLMRARRAQKLSFKQLAEQIKEPESVLIAAEQGTLPDPGYELILKLESALHVSLIRPDVRATIPSEVLNPPKFIPTSNVLETPSSAEAKQEAFFKRKGLFARLFGKKENSEKTKVTEEVEEIDLDESTKPL